MVSSKRFFDLANCHKSVGPTLLDFESVFRNFKAICSCGFGARENLWQIVDGVGKDEDEEMYHIPLHGHRAH